MIDARSARELSAPVEINKRYKANEHLKAIESIIIQAARESKNEIDYPIYYDSGLTLQYVINDLKNLGYTVHTIEDRWENLTLTIKW